MDKAAKKRKRVQLTIENKIKVCEMAKKNVPKSVIMSQFSIDWIILNTFWEARRSLKSWKGGAGTN